MKEFFISFAFSLPVVTLIFLWFGGMAKKFNSKNADGVALALTLLHTGIAFWIYLLVFYI